MITVAPTLCWRRAHRTTNPLCCIVSGCVNRFCDQRLTTSGRSEDYNNRVHTPFPPKLAAQDKHPDDRRQHHHATYAAEATGLLLMAVLLLILTIIRYWRYIPWNAR